MLDQRGRVELGRGTDITGATDGVGIGVAVASGFTGRTDGVGMGVAVASGLAGTLDGVGALAGFGGALSSTDALAGFGGALDSTEGRVFGGALDSKGDPHSAGRGSALDNAVVAGSLDNASFGGVLAAAGSPESVARLGGTLDRVGFGVTLDRARGGDDGIFGATLDDAALGTTLDGAGGTDTVGFGGMLEGRGGAGFGVALAVGSAPTGTVVLTATFTGTLAESGMSSQPASISSSPGFARLSAPIAISLKGTRTAREVAASTVPFSVEAHAKFYEPRHLHRALRTYGVAIRDRHGRAIASLERPGTGWHRGKRSGGGGRHDSRRYTTCLNGGSCPNAVTVSEPPFPASVSS